MEGSGGHQVCGNGRSTKVADLLGNCLVSCSFCHMVKQCIPLSVWGPGPRVTGTWIKDIRMDQELLYSFVLEVGPGCDWDILAPLM